MKEMMGRREDVAIGRLTRNRERGQKKIFILLACKRAKNEFARGKWVRRKWKRRRKRGTGKEEGRGGGGGRLTKREDRAESLFH